MTLIIIISNNVNNIYTYLFITGRHALNITVYACQRGDNYRLRFDCWVIHVSHTVTDSVSEKQHIFHWQIILHPITLYK